MWIIKRFKLPLLIFLVFTQIARGCQQISAGLNYTIRNCKIARFPKWDKWSNYVRVNLFNLSNRIHTIQNGTFAVGATITEIDFESIGLKVIELDAFTGASNLEKLYLKGNELSELKVGVFDALVQLQVLWLHNNHLTIIPENIFDKNQKLKTLYLDSNRIIAMGSIVFDKLKLKLWSLKVNLCVTHEKQEKGYKELLRESNCIKFYETLIDFQENLKYASEELEEKIETFKYEKILPRDKPTKVNSYKMYILSAVVIELIAIAIILIVLIAKKIKSTQARPKSSADDLVYSELDFPSIPTQSTVQAIGPIYSNVTSQPHSDTHTIYANIKT